jgi:acyl carrier protein
MAERTLVEQRIAGIIIRELKVADARVIPTASFSNDFGADSLDTIELITAIEEEFMDEINGEIPETDARSLNTVGSIVEYIGARILSARGQQALMFSQSARMKAVPNVTASHTSGVEGRATELPL